MTDRILFVDDEDNILKGYQRLLRGRYQCDTADNAYNALNMVDTRGPYAVIVADMQMPGMDGVELLARVRESAPETVRVMVTGNSDQQTTVDAVNRAAVFRFLNKPCSREALIETLDDALADYRQAVDGRERLARATANVDQLTERLNYEAHHDILTGLVNRHAFEQALQQYLLAAAHIGRGEHALCHLDLDHFHLVNDTYGHVAGDALLRSVGNFLSSKCRQRDLVGRLAGDEFGILLLDCPIDAAQRIIKGILTALEQMAFEWQGTKLELPASAGLVSTQGHTGNAAALLTTAKTACQVAQEHGRGQLHIAAPGDEALSERLDQVQWVSRIGTALRENRFRLFGQRIASLGQTTEGSHLELLIRMLGEDGRLIPPGAFLGAAERYHLSSRVDRWVIKAAADWLSQGPEHLEHIGLCSINLSGHSVGDPEILNFIQHTFDGTAIPTHKVCFEITETAAIAHMGSAFHFIRELKDQGFQFALDDFGSGLSSFGYLKNLPVDYLKIDGVFVRHIDTDTVDCAVVRCIAEVARAMGKQTIAEYVENVRIFEQLRNIGVDFAQGYYIAKPCPLSEFELPAA